MSLMQMIRQKSYFVKLVLIITSIIFLGLRYASAQVVHYSFDMCDGNDEVLLQSDARNLLSGQGEVTVPKTRE